MKVVKSWRHLGKKADNFLLFAFFVKYEFFKVPVTTLRWDLQKIDNEAGISVCYKDISNVRFLRLNQMVYNNSKMQKVQNWLL